MKKFLFIGLIFFISPNDKFFEKIVANTDVKKVFLINEKNKSIVFNKDYLPKINSYYTKGRFTPNKTTISKMERDLSKNFLLTQKLMLEDFLKQQPQLTEQEKDMTRKKYLKIIRRESKRIKKYTKFYYGYTSNDNRKKVFIRLIDFASIDKNELNNWSINKIVNNLFKPYEWNFYGIVHETLIYDINRNTLSGNLTSRIFRFAKEECEVE